MIDLAKQICEFLSKDVYGENNPQMFNLQIDSLKEFLESIKPDKYGSCDFCGWAFDSVMEDYS